MQRITRRGGGREFGRRGGAQDFSRRAEGSEGWRAKYNQNRLAEVELYLNEPRISIKENPLEFWRKNEMRFPYLAKLARVSLAFPATSGSIERRFSVAGSIARARRARITLDNLECILCFRDNMEQEKEAIYEQDYEKL